MSLCVYTAAALGSHVLCTFQTGSPKNYSSVAVRFQIEAIHIRTHNKVSYTLREEDSSWTIEAQHSDLKDDGGNYRYECRCSYQSYDD